MSTFVIVLLCLAVSVVASVIIVAFMAACAIQSAEDDSDNEPHGDHPFIPRACGCSLNLPICDSRACPALFPTERF